MAASVWPVGTDGDIADEDARARCRPEDPRLVSNTVKRLKKRDDIEFVAIFRGAPMCSAVQGEAVGIDERGTGLVLTKLYAQVNRLAEVSQFWP